MRSRICGEWVIGTCSGRSWLAHSAAAINDLGEDGGQLGVVLEMYRKGSKFLQLLEETIEGEVELLNNIYSLISLV
ncbi:hypothetical protein ACSQ67_024794 [Phaseolus vulgaris]